MTSAGLDLLERLEEDPFAPWRGREGLPAVGAICPCVPPELIHAAGFAPVLVPPAVSSAPLADAHLPTACCALARGALEVALRGDSSFLQGMVLHRTCDAMTFLGDLWPHAVGRGFAVVLNLPRQPEEPRAVGYLVGELQRAFGELRQSSGAEGPPQWERTFSLLDRRRVLLADLYRPGRTLSGTLRLRIVQAALLLPPEEGVAWLESIQGELAEREDEGLARRPRLLLYGPTLTDLSLAQRVEDVGAWVVGDDLCNGWRTAHPRLQWSGQVEPLKALARWVVEWPGCPAQHRPSRPRPERLLRRVEEVGAEGVIFVLARFCDPYAFDYPALAAALAARGIPHLLLESELTTPAGQVLTRVQAFLETLEAVP